MTAGLGEATAKASGSRRRAYATPRLVRYGQLRSLTTGGTRGEKEFNPGQETARRP